MEPRTRRRCLISGAITLFVVVAWFAWPSGDLERVKAMRRELFREESKKLPPEERSAKWKELRAATERLSAAQQNELAKEGMQRFQAELSNYAKLAPKEQTRYLDQQIDKMEAGRKKMNQAKGKSDAPGASQQNGGANQKKKDGKSLSGEERERFRKQRLDNSTPEFRALTDRYRKDMQKRLQQRGIQSTGMFGMGPGR